MKKRNELVSEETGTGEVICEGRSIPGVIYTISHRQDVADIPVGGGGAMATIENLPSIDGEIQVPTLSATPLLKAMNDGAQVTLRKEDGTEVRVHLQKADCQSEFTRFIIRG
jgi:hypothetical protein